MPHVGAFIGGALGVGAAPAIGSAAFGAFAQGAVVNTFLTTTMAGRILTTVAISALAAATAPRPATPGIRTQMTMTGGTNPASFVLGRYSTEGQYSCPPMSHGSAGKMPNAYLTYVIELGDVPGQGVDGLLINGEEVTIGAAQLSDYGYPIEGKYAGYAWIKTYDGTQTVADPMLLDKYGSYPERPWTSTMVGAGIPYAILTFRYNRDLFKNFPKVRFVTDGIPLYDPRLDGTVGGSGAHRWDDPTTWEPSSNGAVQAYNIMRGITLPGGYVWGGQAQAADLPLSNWFAAMNACDASVALSGGGTEPAYRSGIEVFVSDQPLAITKEIGKACAMQFIESGGYFKVRVGGPGLPVMFITDDDFKVTSGREYHPFPASDEVFNAVSATYPEPATGWQAKDAPALYNETYEAEDGEQRVADLDYRAAPYGNQVQRLNDAYLKEERRFVRHAGEMTTEALQLEGLDAIAWTSVKYPYSAKVFEVSATSHSVSRSNPHIAVRERDATDYSSWSTADEQAYSIASPVVVLPTPQTLVGWTVTPATIQDSAGGARGPALLVEWPTDDDDVAGVAYELRVKTTGAAVTAGSFMTYDLGGGTVSSGVQSGVEYEMRTRIISASGRATAWSAWVSVTAPTVRVASDWYRYEVAATVTGLSSAQVVTYFATDPGVPAVPGDKYVLVDVTDSANPIEAGYVFNGVAWAEAGRFISEHWFFDNAVTARAIAAQAVTADKVLAASLAALSAVLGKVEVTETLELKHPGAKIMGGKKSPGDVLTPGFMVGRVLRELVTAGNFTSGREYRITSVGTTDFTSIGASANVVGELFLATGIGAGTGTANEIGFEFSATSDAGGSISGLLASDGGTLKLLNANQFVGSPGTSSLYTSSQTVNLGTSQSISIAAIGEGGQGGAGTRNSTGSGFGVDGQDTVVEVWDGDPVGGGVLVATFTAKGGKAGENAAKYRGLGVAGEGSSYGSGGQPGGLSEPGGSAPATHYGAAGASGSSGVYWFFGSTYGYAGTRGEAGEQLTWDVDTSAFASDIFLKLTIGEGGAVNTAYDYDGGAGAGGAVAVNSALSGMLDLGSGVVNLDRSYGQVSTSMAAINAGNVDRINDALPSNLVGHYRVEWSYATDTDASADNSWIVNNSLRLGGTILNSESFTQNDTPSTRTYSGSRFVDLTGGEVVFFRWNQSGDTHITRADLDYLTITITGPYKDVDL